MSQESTSFEDNLRPLEGPRSRWQENHGNVLVLFVLLVIGVGSLAILFRRQFQLPPVSEPIAIAPSAPTLVELPWSENAIKIHVIGAANDVGSIMIAVCGNADQFIDFGLSLDFNRLPIRDGEATWLVPEVNLPARLAVIAFHDLNSDGRLDRNPVGVASERYGYTRNARLNAEAEWPLFEDVVVARPPVGATINVFIR